MKKIVGKIESFHLGTEAHNIFTMYLYFDFGGSSQGFGGYVLDVSDGKGLTKEAINGKGAGLDYIKGIMDALGVDEIQKLKGLKCYALKEDDTLHKH